MEDCFVSNRIEPHIFESLLCQFSLRLFFRENIFTKNKKYNKKEFFIEFNCTTDLLLIHFYVFLQFRGGN